MKVIQENKANIGEVVTALKNGAVLVLPTDTVYGLVCDATNKKAVEKIFKIKKRDKIKPLPVFVKDIKMAEELAEISRGQKVILKKYWPGKFTFVLKLKKTETRPLSSLVAGKDNTIALRVPKYKLLNDLLKKINRPLAQTSVNISGQPPLTKMKEIIAVFINNELKPDLIIDAGDLVESKPSKIVDLSAGKGKVLRY